MFTFCDIFSVICDSRIHFMDHIPLLVYSQLVSVLHSGTVGLGFKSQPQRCRVTRTHTRLTTRYCRVTVLCKLLTPVVPLFTKQRNW